MKRVSRADETIGFWFFAVGILGILAGLLVVTLYAFWQVITNPLGASPILWFLVALISFLGLSRLLQWLMRRRLLPEPLIARLQRAGGAGEGTLISKVGFGAAAVAVGCGFIGGVGAALSGMDPYEPAGTFGLIALTLVVFALILEMVWRFIRDPEGPR